MSQETVKIRREEEPQEGEERKKETEGEPAIIPVRPPGGATPSGRKPLREEQEKAEKMPEVPLIEIPTLNIGAIELYEIDTAPPKAVPPMITPKISPWAIKPSLLRKLTLKRISIEVPLPFNPYELIELIGRTWPSLRIEKLPRIGVNEPFTTPPETFDLPSEMEELMNRSMVKPKWLVRPKPSIGAVSAVKTVPKEMPAQERAEEEYPGSAQLERELREEEKRVAKLLRELEGWSIGLEEGEGILEKVLGLRAVNIMLDRPFIIFAIKPYDRRYEYVEYLKLLLRELYRVRAIGLPSPRHLAIGFEKETLHIKAGGHVYTMDIDDKIWERLKKEEKEKEFLDYVRDRIRELFSQGFGFLVFYGSEGVLEEVKKLWKEIPPVALPPKPIEMRPIEHDALFTLVNLTWGIMRIELPGEGASLDIHAVEREYSYYDALLRVANSLPAALLVKPSPEPEEGLPRPGESVEHYALKAFVVRYFIEEEKIPADRIKTEYEIRKDLFVDVYIEDHPTLGRVIIEVETLYGTGLPLTKLVRTIETRYGLADRLWIVIPNPQAMLFLNQILALREYCVKRKIPVEFYVIDVEEKRLVPITELKNKVDEIEKTLKVHKESVTQ